MTEDLKNMDNYYQHVMEVGRLRTIDHARRWSSGVLKTMGFHMKGGGKKALAAVLPQELASDLKAIFWLVHFHDNSLTPGAFQKQVARRCGNSDSEFAYYPVLAVFSGLRRFYTDSALNDKITAALPDAIATLWREADPERLAAGIGIPG